MLCYCNHIKNVSSTFYDQWGELFRALGVQDGPQLPPGDVRDDGQHQQGLPLHHMLRQEQVPTDPPHPPLHPPLQQADDEEG